MYLFLPNTPATRCVNSNFTFHNVSISTEQRCWPLRLLILYIPQCIYFYIYLCNCQYCNRPLHSTMYLFLRFWAKTFWDNKHLYIPQCIYFYLALLIPCCIGRSFTFHNVSISTLSFCAFPFMILLYIPQCIYFYVNFGALPAAFSSLHSTMYLFLPGSPFPCFSGHSSFTFHNVSISTPTHKGQTLDREMLYIPQCIYFYVVNRYIILAVPTLHSTMYLFLPGEKKE